MPLKFFPLDLRTVVEGSEPDFDLYIKQHTTGKMVLYRSKGLPFTEQVAATLRANRHEVVYVPQVQRRRFEAYLERNLAAIARNESLPVQERCEIVYTTSTRIMQAVFEELRASEAIRRSQHIITPTISLILQGEEVVRKLIELTAHDYYTYTHSVNVCIFSVALAGKIFPGEGREKLERLGSGFLLHDIGKRRISPEIINKRGRLTPEEWDIMRQHPQFSHDILRETGYLTSEAAVIALQHHERHDGSGYPSGLRGDEIHTYAKICSIADAFDAMTTKRSYRDPSSSFEALQVMQSEMAGNFDRDFFVTFVSLFGPRPTYVR
jgi:HD-GYP domain-containing protein (c-di-GMP phosphodiesterase class II)